MSSEHLSFTDHPLYQQAIDAFQLGEYEEGKTHLEALLEKYPLSPELRALNQEMILKSRIDQDEISDQHAQRRARLSRIVVRTGMLVGFVLLVAFGIRTYSGWIRTQVQSAQFVLEQQAQQLELGVRYNNARSLVVANRPLEAQQLVDQIRAENPDYPNLDELQVQINQIKSIEEQYLQAVKLVEVNDPAALSELRALQASYPGYKDVPQLIENLERNSLLAELYMQGNVAYQEAEWDAAIPAYERILSIDPTYRSGEVEPRLFESYLAAGEQMLTNPEGGIEDFDLANNYFRAALALRPQDITALEKQAEAQKKFADLQISEYVNQAGDLLRSQGDSLTALEDAETLFSEALRIRPNDPELLLEVDMARSFLAAIQEFEKGNWNLVIGNLETVVQQDPEYAVGTAQQALYEAYIGRGDSWLAVGDYYAALSDYEQAAFLAEQSSNALILLMQAQIKLAEIRGLLGEFENAVLLYQSVVDQLRYDLNQNLDNQRVLSLLDSAETYSRNRNYSLAYQRYREAMTNPSELFTFVEYEVKEGDYIASIANRFNTTIEAIANASKIENPNQILSGQKLVIPSFMIDRFSGESAP
jgi:tetratricopeptide (TPR) repeat protein